jgi:hypothetical protein
VSINVIDVNNGNLVAKIEPMKSGVKSFEIVQNAPSTKSKDEVDRYLKSWPRVKMS